MTSPLFSLKEYFLFDLSLLFTEETLPFWSHSSFRSGNISFLVSLLFFGQGTLHFWLRPFFSEVILPFWPHPWTAKYKLSMPRPLFSEQTSRIPLFDLALRFVGGIPHIPHRFSFQWGNIAYFSAYLTSSCFQWGNIVDYTRAFFSLLFIWPFPFFSEGFSVREYCLFELAFLIRENTAYLNSPFFSVWEYCLLNITHDFIGGNIAYLTSPSFQWGNTAHLTSHFLSVSEYCFFDVSS